MIKGGSIILSKKLYKLTIGRGGVFWATTIAVSLLPIATKYRAAFSERSWNIQTVWVDSLLVGMVIGCCVSYFLLRFFPGFGGITYLTYPLGFISEFGLTLWLLIMGAREQKPASIEVG